MRSAAAVVSAGGRLRIVSQKQMSSRRLGERQVYWIRAFGSRVEDCRQGRGPHEAGVDCEGIGEVKMSAAGFDKHEPVDTGGTAALSFWLARASRATGRFDAFRCISGEGLIVYGGRAYWLLTSCSCSEFSTPGFPPTWRSFLSSSHALLCVPSGILGEGRSLWSSNGRRNTR